MRLWTFQTKHVLDSLEKDGIWYMLRLMSNRLKFYDECYDGEVVINGETLDTIPVYCWSKMRGYSSLPLRAFVGCLADLNGYWKFDLCSGRKYMYELEVPENFILNVKDAAEWFCTYADDMPDGLPNHKKLDYRVVENEDQIFTSNFKRHNRQADYDMEAVIPYIKKEWVVCYREFKAIRRAEYCTHKVVTHVLNEDKFPSWTETIYINGDAYMRVPKVENPKKESDFDTLGNDRMKELISKISMNGCPRYYTVREALDSCNSATCNKVLQRAQEMRVFEEMFDNTLILDLFPDGLFPEEVTV